MGIRSIVVREEDVIFRTSERAELEDAMSGAQGSLRVIGSRDAAGMSEIYFRPPPKYLEPPTLLAVLRHRLVSGAAAAG